MTQKIQALSLAVASANRRMIEAKASGDRSKLQVAREDRHMWERKLIEAARALTSQGE